MRSTCNASSCSGCARKHCLTKAVDDLMEGLRVFPERKGPHPIDEMKMRSTLTGRDQPAEPHGLVERAEAIVTAPNDLRRHRDACSTAEFVEARLGFHQAGDELVLKASLADCGRDL